MSKVLSISVAAYNVEKFIEKNLDSFVKASEREKIEVLVTDDGSKDSTPQIVEKYEKEYPGVVRLIKQPNAGPGSTVNSGIKHATGKYFRMVDGDDWVRTENIDKFVQYLENNDVDMVVANYCLVDNDTEEEVPKHLDVEYDKIMRFEDICADLTLDMHNVTFKTSILQENSITLDNCFYTDIEYLLLPMPYVNTVVFLDTIIYMYRVSLSTQSISVPSMQKNINMHELVLNRLENYYEENKVKMGDNKSKYMCTRIANMEGTQLSTLLSFKSEKKYKDEIKKRINDLKIKSPDIYNQYRQKRTVKVLEKTNYLTYRIISKLHRKKIGA